MRMRAANRWNSQSVVTLLVSVAVVPFLAACRRGDAAPAPPPPLAVSVVELTPESIEVSSEWIATLDGLVNAEIRAQVSGYIVRRAYREGTPVRKGDVLFEIDPRPFEAVVAQTRGQLAQAQAQLGKAERDVARDTPLAEARAIPQQQLDDDVQARLAALAGVQAAQAAVDTAELNLGFTRVRSLVDGIAAIASAQVGDQVSPSTLLTTVSQVDPIRAYFAISEDEYIRIASQINRPVGAKGLWNTGPALTLTLADGKDYPRNGSFLAADRQIDPTTGTIRISGVFPNPSGLLRPGQYGRVRAATAVVPDALLVPQRAVAELQGLQQVRVVGTDNKVEVKTVTLGQQSGDRWIVAKGLEPGARVVVDAPLIRPGTVVTPAVLAAYRMSASGAGQR
jgi:RND family efflux transporter MFP subunit